MGTRATRGGKAAAGHRTCGDCTRVYRVGAGDPRWCPACVTAHTGRCSDCRAAFDLDGYHRQCPACREQVALFPVIADHLLNTGGR